MNCPRCNTILIATTFGGLCPECGYIQANGYARPEVTPHSVLMHSEHRVADEEEPGVGLIDEAKDGTAFTAESRASVGAFTWIQVTVGRFSYYATVFVLVFVLAGISYNVYFNHSNDQAKNDCQRDITTSSSTTAEAQVSPRPTPTCH